MDRLPPPTADFDLQLFSDPWRIVVSVGDSIVGSASLLPILPICLTPVESREVYHIHRAGLNSSHTTKKKTASKLIRNLSKHSYKNNDCSITNIIHTFKSNKPSSQRTQVGKVILHGCSKARSKTQRQHRNNKSKKQLELKNVDNASSEHTLSAQVLDKKCCVFKDDASESLFVSNNQTSSQLDFISLSLFLTTDVGQGGAMFRPQKAELPVLLKTPRNKNLTTFAFEDLVIKVLGKLESQVKFQQRGKKRFVAQDSNKSSYVTVGMTANRGGKGIVPSKLHLMSKKDLKTMVRFVKQIEEEFYAWADWSYIFGFSNFNKIQDIPTLGVN